MLIGPKGLPQNCVIGPYELQMLNILKLFSVVLCVLE
jgi:hypothetical protein